MTGRKFDIRYLLLFVAAESRWEFLKSHLVEHQCHIVKKLLRSWHGWHSRQKDKRECTKDQKNKSWRQSNSTQTHVVLAGLLQNQQLASRCGMHGYALPKITEEGRNKEDKTLYSARNYEQRRSGRANKVRELPYTPVSDLVESTADTRKVRELLRKMNIEEVEESESTKI